MDANQKSQHPTRIGWIPTDTFAIRLVLIRRQLGLTIRDAAELCGQHYATWSAWERGAQPNYYSETVQAISTALGVERDWLAWGGELKKPPGRAAWDVMHDSDGRRRTSVTDQYVPLIGSDFSLATVTSLLPRLTGTGHEPPVTRTG